MTRPDLSLEYQYGFDQGTIICGVDEVGRGAIAGPVISAAVILPSNGLDDSLACCINDSKKIAPSKRQILDRRIRQHVTYALGQSEVSEIDTINILQATLLAMTRAVSALPISPSICLIDGLHVPCLASHAIAVVKGDQKSLSIAASSIIAKVARDRLMADLARAYPEFGWERNVGYPTRAHRAALNYYGMTPHHRRSFHTVGL